MNNLRPSPADPNTSVGIGADGLRDRPASAEPGHTEQPRESVGPRNAGAINQSVAVPSPWPELFRRPVRYPNAYCWYVLVCALDLMLTNTAIHHAGAIEVNGIAAHAIETAGFWGLIILKVSTMIVVLLACELIGEACFRKGHPKDTGLKLAEWAVAISAIPVVLTLLQLGFVAAANLMLT